MNKSRKVCIITGAGSGIGLATAIEMSKRGFDLICVGRNIDKHGKDYSDNKSLLNGISFVE